MRDEVAVRCADAPSSCRARGPRTEPVKMIIAEYSVDSSV
jgi:hypothetical protein